MNPLFLRQANAKFLVASALSWLFFGATLQAPGGKQVAPKAGILEERVEELLWGDFSAPQPDEALRFVELADPEADVASKYVLLGKIAFRYRTMGYLGDEIKLYEGFIDKCSDESYRRVLRVLIAQCYEEAGLREQAVHVWEDLKRRGPLHPRELRRLARLCSELGAYQEATRYFEQIGPWSLELYVTQSGSGAGDAERWRRQAEHFMRIGRWEDALSYWRLNPRVVYAICAFSTPTVRDVQVEYNQARCLHALGRQQEALAILTKAIQLGGLSRVFVDCAQLYVEIMGERGERADVAGLEPGGQKSQVLQGVGGVVAKVSSGDIEGLASILAVGAEGLNDDDAIRATKRVAIDLVVGLGLAMREALRQHVGQDSDLYVCVALAGMGDAAVIERVREFVSEGEGWFELEDRLKLLVALGTDDAYDLLETFARAQDEGVRKYAGDLIRRYPRAWPAPSVSSLFFRN